MPLGASIQAALSITEAIVVIATTDFWKFGFSELFTGPRSEVQGS